MPVTISARTGHTSVNYDHNKCHYQCDYRVDEEGVAKFTLQKQLREMQNQLQEVAEDLDTEKEARNKAEKQKKDLNEVGHSLIGDQ